MSAYDYLSEYYDSLTLDVDYNAFADYYEKLFESRGVKPELILDIACGTGTLSCIMAERGYNVTASDISCEMLSKAYEKVADKSGNRPLFINQSMDELDLPDKVDSAYCSLDGMNYVSADTLEKTFIRLHELIVKDGLLIFDINSPYKLKNLDGEVFIDENDDVFCVWRTEYSEEDSGCWYGIDLFSKQGRLWKRSFEEHFEYCHEPDMLCGLLKKCGFEDIKVFGDMTFTAPETEEQRIFIVAANK